MKQHLPRQSSADRRDFLKGGLAAGALTLGLPGLGAAQPATSAKFRMHYGPHLGMFRHSAGEDSVAQLEFMADQGFTAFEDNGMAGRPVEEQKRIAAALERLGMKMGVFVAHTHLWEKNLSTGDAAPRDRFVKDIENAVEVAKRVGATWCTVVPGMVEPRLEPDYQTANVVEALRRAADVCEPAGLVMVLEPLNPWRDHPGMFLAKIPQAYLVCKAVGSPSCKILFDIYHQQITEGNLIPNIDRAWDEIAYFQIGDNPGRKEPTTGEINYRNVFRHIHAKDFQGILGMEHGNSKSGVEGERALIEAYRSCDDF